MTRIRSYRDLDVWQQAMDLVVQVYELTKRFPDEERFGLTSQLRRAAVSIPSNIAEGHARLSRNEYRHHLSIARGSLAETETQLLLANRLGYATRDDLALPWEQAQSVGRLLNALLNAL